MAPSVTTLALQANQPERDLQNTVEGREPTPENCLLNPWPKCVHVYMLISHEGKATVAMEMLIPGTWDVCHYLGQP